MCEDMEKYRYEYMGRYRYVSKWDDTNMLVHGRIQICKFIFEYRCEYIGGYTYVSTYVSTRHVTDE